MTTQLRLATQDDLKAIVALDQLIFGAYGAEESPDVIRARLAVFPTGCAVLVDGDTQEKPQGFEQPQGIPPTVAGYLTTEKWVERRTPVLDEDPTETHDANGTVLNITTLAVAPGTQGRGHGKRLLDHAIAIAQREGCREIVLETARAKDFYQKHGFELIEERLERDIPMAIMRLGI